MSDQQAPARLSIHRTIGGLFAHFGDAYGTPYLRADLATLAASPEVQSLVRQAVEAERERCAGIAQDHKGLGPASGWGPDEREGYENGQADMQSVIAAAIRGEGGE